MCQRARMIRNAVPAAQLACAFTNDGETPMLLVLYQALVITARMTRTFPS